MSLVLVVDDNPSFRHLASRILEEWGYDVVEAGSVAEAVVLGLQYQPDVALVDVGLPDGDGFQLVGQMLEVSSHTRVVLLSTDSDRGNSFAAKQAGAIGFFAKDELLRGSLRDLLARS